MPYFHRKAFIRLGLLRGLTGALLLSLIAGTAWGYSSGPLDGYCGDPPNYNNCTACHNSYQVNSGDGQLQLLGLPPAYMPDSTYMLIIALVDTGQIQHRWGFEMTAVLNNGDQGGTLAPDEPLFVQISEGPGAQRDYAKHTTLGTLEGSPAGAWVIVWTAPAAASDSVHFYLAGNAANGDGTNQLDYIYTTSVHVPEFVDGIAETPPVYQPATPVLIHAYPNPFNPDVALRLEGFAARDPVTIEIYNLLGNRLEVLDLGPGNGQGLNLSLDLAYLPSGTYLVRALSGSRAAAVRLVKAK